MWDVADSTVSLVGDVAAGVVVVFDIVYSSTAILDV